MKMSDFDDIVANSSSRRQTIFPAKFTRHLIPRTVKGTLHVIRYRIQGYLGVDAIDLIMRRVVS